MRDNYLRYSLVVVTILYCNFSSLAQVKLYTPSGSLESTNTGFNQGIGIDTDQPLYNLHVVERQAKETAVFIDLEELAVGTVNGQVMYEHPDYALKVKYSSSLTQDQIVYSIDAAGRVRTGWQTSGSEQMIIGQSMAVYRASNNRIRFNFLNNVPTLGWNSSTRNLQFRNESTGNAALTMSPTGKVGVNTTNFVGSHSLYIEGSTIAEEIFVKLEGFWPDYVFSDSYDLMPLEDLGKFISEEGHLPNMPTAEEVAVDGLALGETERLLTEKVEELTLYLLQMKEEMDKLKRELESLQSTH